MIIPISYLIGVVFSDELLSNPGYILFLLFILLWNLALGIYFTLKASELDKKYDRWSDE